MLSFAYPWGLLALAGIPALVALHFFRHRFRPREVAGLFLWPPGDILPPSGRRRSRLELPLTLLCEILAVLLLAALASGAQWEELTSSPHIIAVLDHSMSMSARADGESAADRALRELRRACAGESTRLTAILSGLRPAVVVGPAVPAAEGLETLASWRPRLPGHSLAPAADLARRIAEEGGNVIIITDHPDRAVQEAGTGLRIIGVGRPLGNAALTVAERSLDGSVFVRGSNFSTGSVERTLSMRDASGQVRASQKLTLAPKELFSLTWTLPPDHGPVEIVLEGTDAIEADDRAWLAPPGPRNVRVRCDLPPDSRARAAVQRACKASPYAVWVDDDPDLVIVPGERSSAFYPAGTWVLGIGAPPDEWRDGAALDPLLGPYFADPSHPLMEQIDFRGVVWTGAFPIRKDAPPAALLTAGDVPLLVRKPGADVYLMNIDLERSNVPKSPAWPMLIHNLVLLRQDALPGLRRWNYRVGEEVSWRRADQVEVLGLDGKPLSRIRTRSGMETVIPETAGLYHWKFGPTQDEIFAVNFLDPRESDLLGAHDASPAASETSRGDLERARAWPWLGPLACFLLLALVVADLWLVRLGRSAS